MAENDADIRTLHRYIDQAGRYALSSLFYRVKKPLTMEQKHARVAKLWQKAAYALPAHGWEPFAVDCRGKLFRCPPFGKLAGSFSWLCGERHICPWCWCRCFVRDLYLNLEDIYFGRDELPTAKLLEGHTYTSVDLEKHGMPAVWKYMALTAKTNVAAFVLPSKTYGIWWQQTVEPDIAKGTGWTGEYWRIHFRLLALVPAKCPDDLAPKATQYDEPSTRRTACVHTVKSKKDLVIAAGSTLRYPAGLLLGKPDRVVEILNVRKNAAGPTGRRRGPYVSSRRFGVFRNTKFKRGIERPTFVFN